MATAASFLSSVILCAGCGGPGAAISAQTPAGSVEGREHLRRGTELARQGLHDGAAAELRLYLAEVPGDADAHFQLGRSLMELARRQQAPLSEAIRELEQSFKLDPDKDYVRLQLAEVYGWRIPGTFAPQRSMEIIEDLLKRSPDRFDVRLRYAQWILTAEVRLARKGDPARVLQDSGWGMDLARFQLEKVLDMAPRDSDAAIEARSLLGEIQFRSGEWDAARATMEYLLSSYESRQLNVAPIWETIAHTFWRQARYKEAAGAFRKAYDLVPSSAYQYGIKISWDLAGGYPRDLPPRYRFPLREEAIDASNPPDLKFTDIAPRLHINKNAGAGPAGWADYNGDGRMDLVACGCDTFCTLYRAAGTGFVDATVEAGLSRLEPGFASAWADYDNDGDPDLYVARNGWNGPAPDSLLRNEGNGTFTDVGASAGVSADDSTDHAAWFDYDRDGWLDLIVSNGVYIDGSGNRLYRNLGDGTFRNVTDQAGLSEKPLFGTIGIALADFDDDGWPDIFMHGRLAPNRLYMNNRDGTFREAATRAGVAGPGTQRGWTAIAADLDSDGDMDILTGSLAPWEHVLAAYRPEYKTGPMDNIPRLYRNNGDGTFSDSSLTAGFRYPLGVMAVNAADLDNDGFLDVYFGTGDPDLRRLEPNILYHNMRDGTFEDVTRFAGVGRLGKGHGIIFHDWDGDGDLEIYAELGGFYHGDLWENAFFLNEAGNRNHWLSIKLDQPGRNRFAIGARVTLRAPGLVLAQELTAGRGFGSTDPPILHFGLGNRKRADRLEIRWPDGAAQVMEDVKIDRQITIHRPASVVAPAAHP